MKKASIVSIGNELLNGQTVNSNAAYLGVELLRIGIPVAGSYAVADEIDEIVRALGHACEQADVIIATGGLGPTDDDLTRQAMAKFLGVELELHDDLLDKIQHFFNRMNRRMPERNEIQAYIPAGAKALPNVGTAPGIKAESKGKLLFALPGVPQEMKRMLGESVLPDLKQFAGVQAVAVRKLKCFGAGESTIAELLGNAMQRGRNPLINCTVTSGIITLHIIASAKNETEAQAMAEKDEQFLRGLLGDLVYGTDDESLADVVGEKMVRRAKTVAVAESCTGGLLAKLLTDIPGASRYFTHGWITYSNQAKIDELGVPADVIEKHGAVSKQVAESMARGARRKAGTDFAIGITGIAGPGGATEQKPAGLVYISIDSDQGCDIEKCVFSYDRRFVRLRSAQTALNMLRLKLNN
jgi:nicotinamide-nucleotide amidase